MSGYERMIVLARALRKAALGEACIPPCVPAACLPALGARFERLAPYLSADLAGSVRTIGQRLAQRDTDLSDDEALELAVWLETHAPRCHAGERRLAAGSNPRGAA